MKKTSFIPRNLTKNGVVAYGILEAESMRLINFENVNEPYTNNSYNYISEVCLLLNTGTYKPAIHYLEDDKPITRKKNIVNRIKYISSFLSL